MFEENYLIAKRALAEFEDEARCLEINLTSAVESENVEEVARLKGRAKDLPYDLYAAKVLLIKAEIEKLEDQQRENYQKLSSAKADLRAFDSQITPQIENLQREVSRFQKVILGRVCAVTVAEADIVAKSRRIADAKRRLEKLVCS